MKNNIVVQLMKLRKQFNDSAENQSNLITTLSDISQTEGSIVPQTINTASGKPWQISTGYQSGVKRIIIQTWSNFSDLNVAPDITKYIPIDAIEGVNLDTYIDGVNCTLFDLLNDVRETQNTNSVFAEVCSLFQTNNRVDTQVAVDLIDQISDTNSANVIQLKQLLLKNSPEGKISQYQYLMILKGIFNEGKDATENNSLKMNTNGAFFVANAIGTIILTALSYLTSIIGAVLSMINVVLGLIVTAIGAIFSLIGRLIGSAVRTGITVNTDTPLNIYDAPIFYVSDDGRVDGQNTQYCSDLTDTEARLFVLGSLTWYMWNNPVENKGFMSNGFLAISVDPVRTLEWLYTAFNVSWNSSTSVLTYVQHSGIEIPDSVYLTTDEIVELQFKSDEELRELTWFNMAFLSIIASMPEYTYGTLDFGSTYAKSFIENIRNSSNKRIKYYQLLTQWMLYLVWFSSEWVNYEHDLHWCLHYENPGFTAENLTDYAIMIQEGERAMSAERPSNTGIAAWYPYPINHEYSDAHGNLCYHRHHRSLSGAYIVGVGGSDTFSIAISPECSVSEIPTSGMFSFATARWSEVIWAIAIMAAVTTAAVIGFAVGKVKFTKWRVKKQLSEQAKLTAARNDYIDKDTGEIKGGWDEYNAYYKQIKRYNKWGRLLGYGTYDPTNNWTNAFETSVPDMSSLTESVTEDVKTLTSDGQLSLTSVTGSATDPVTLQDIKHYITGN